MRAVFAGLTLLVASSAVAAPRGRDRDRRESAREPVWLAEELPLPLSVRTPEDLAFKAETERQFLIFNLLAGGKVAWDKGDATSAAAKWERLLLLPELPKEIDQVVRPLALEARKRAGGTPVAELPPAPTGDASATVASGAPTDSAVATALRKPKTSATLQGTVTGLTGQNGAVVWLKRANGETPSPRPASGKVIYQREKRFVPRLLAVTVGTTVKFRNDDQIFHNVFSLSRPNDFDLGLYKGGVDRTQRFSDPGPVNLLCNIHAAMSAFVYVVDSPWYAQTDRRGAFKLTNVPPGEYVLHAWQETSGAPAKQPVTVKLDGSSVTIAVSSDKPVSQFPPDKAGKPRQPQLGY